MPVVIGLTMDIPRDSPDLGSDVLQPSGVAPLFFEEAREMGEGLTGTKQWAREGRQVMRSLERPPPGTMYLSRCTACLGPAV